MTSPPAIRHVEVPSNLRKVKRLTPAPVKSATNRAVRRWAFSGGNARTLPHFLIIGTKRGGTTSLWHWLVDHPLVLPMFPKAQELKSPHYFDINYWRGERWYRSFFPTYRGLQRAQKRSGCRPVTGEASPYYMWHPAAPARVKETVPNVRLLVLLRDPVARAYSNYWERRGAGTENLPTFEEALAAEEARLSGEAERLMDPRHYSFQHDNHAFLARGRYIEHLAPWLEHFTREQLLVLRAEDLFANPQATFGTVQRFLGLPVTAPANLQHHNRLPVTPMHPATMERLVEYYRPFNAALYEALGTDYGWERRYDAPGGSRGS